MQQRARLDSLLFDYETTNRTSYRNTELVNSVPTVYKKKPTCLRIRPPPLRDIHTLSDWKTAVPFSLLHKKKDIIRTNPRSKQEAFSKPEDSEKEQAQRTRPRLVMTPAVSMDDIADPTARQILCDDMYTSDMTRATREAVAPYFCVRAPLPDHPAIASPIFLPQLKPPLVSPEWRMDSVSWDNRQLRAHTDATMEFWMAQKLNKCKACEETAIIKAHRKMLREMKRAH